jgi:hypothetical protein
MQKPPSSENSQKPFLPISLRGIVLLGAFSLTIGCNTFVNTALKNARLDPPIKIVKASPVYRLSETGRGLDITISAETSSAVYDPDFEEELRAIADIFHVLAQQDKSLDYNYLAVTYLNRYRGLTLFEKPKNEVTAAVVVIMKKEDLAFLRANQAPPEEFRNHWRIVSGVKEQPDAPGFLNIK